MSKGINKVILIGNLGNDPESRSFPDGSAVTNISMATSESWRDKTSGEMQERTEWHRVSMRDRGNYKLGQIAAQYLRKGSKVYIEGKLQTRKWTDSQGIERYTTEIIAENLQMLDSKAEAGDKPTTTNNAQAAAAYAQATGKSGNMPTPSYSAPDFDDDIPF